VIGSGFYGISHILLGCVNAKKYSKKQRWDIWMNYSTNQNAEGSDGLSSMLRIFKVQFKGNSSRLLHLYVNNIAFSLSILDLI